MWREAGPSGDSALSMMANPERGLYRQEELYIDKTRLHECLASLAASLRDEWLKMYVGNSSRVWIYVRVSLLDNKHLKSIYFCSSIKRPLRHENSPHDDNSRRALSLVEVEKRSRFDR